MDFLLVFSQYYFRRYVFNFSIKLINKLEIHFKNKNELEIWVHPPHCSIAVSSKLKHSALGGNGLMRSLSATLRNTKQLLGQETLSSYREEIPRPVECLQLVQNCRLQLHELPFVLG